MQVNCVNFMGNSSVKQEKRTKPASCQDQYVLNPQMNSIDEFVKGVKEKTKDIQANNSPNAGRPTDPDIQELRKIALRYKLYKNDEDKINLYKQEDKILKQELREPEKYVDRAINMGVELSGNQEKQKKQLQTAALLGIRAHLGTMKELNWPLKHVNSIVPDLEAIIKDTPEDSETNKKLKLYAMHPIARGYEGFNPENKEKVDNLLLDVLKNSETSNIKNMAFSTLGRSTNKDEPFYKDLQNMPYKKWKSEDAGVEDKKDALINLGKLESPKLEKIIPEILEDEKEDPSIKMAAAWSAGKVRTPENMHALENVINNSPSSEETPEDLHLKEMAIASLRKYKETDKKEVIDTLKHIEEPELQDLAEASLEVIKGKNKEPDYYINKENLTEQQEGQYLKDRAKYVHGINEIGTKGKNRVDEGLLPYRKAVGTIGKCGATFTFADGAVSEAMKMLMGERTFDGRFWDAVSGVNAGKDVVMSKSALDRSDNVTAHEFQHAVHGNVLDFDDYNKVTELYNEAKEDKNFLDYYSASNPHEYFAMGYGAYVGSFVPHKDMASKDDYYSGISSKLDLKLKDPKLYDFIEHCIAKYGQSNKADKQE